MTHPYRALRVAGLMGAAAGTCFAVDHFVLADSVQRNLRTLYTGAAIAVDYKLNFVEGADAGELAKIHQRSADRILATCKDNGGLYIKFGQSIAAQAHVMPPQYQEAFKELYDNAPVVSEAEVRKLFQEEFGKAPEEIFEDFEWQPLGSASIAQVHRAKLRDGTRVAVKVQKPYIRKQMNMDLACQRLVTRALERAFSIPMTWSLEYAQGHIRREVDFINEARNAERAAHDFAQEPAFATDVHVPRIYWDQTSERVMTMEWIDGTPLTNTEDIRRRFDYKAVVGKIVDMFGFQIFKSGFLHADPHPGNILIRENPDRRGRPQVVLLDHGLYIEEAPSFRILSCSFWKSLMLGDLDTFRQVCSLFGFGDIQLAATAALQRPFDPERAKREGGSALSGEVNVYDAQMGMKDRAKQMLADEQKFPRELVFVGKNMATVQGINEAFGSAVDRIAMTARWAVRGTTSSESLSHTFAQSCTTCSSRVSWTYWWLTEHLTSYKFEAHLLGMAAAFYAAKFYTWFWKDLWGYANVLGYEEMLDRGMKEAMRAHFGAGFDGTVIQ